MPDNPGTMTDFMNQLMGKTSKVRMVGKVGKEGIEPTKWRCPDCDRILTEFPRCWTCDPEI